MFPLNETGILTNTIKTHETPLPPPKNKQTPKKPKADKQTQTLFLYNVINFIEV